jgi:hypothetical protein
MTKSIRTALLAAAITAALALPVLAAPEEAPFFAGADQADVTYSGPLDPRTGLPLDQSRQDPEELSVQLGYDKSKRAFTYPAGDLTFTSSVPNGAILSLVGMDKVSVILPDGLNGTLYRNGDVVTGVDLTAVTAPGSYLLDIRGGSSSQSATLSFTIVDELTSSMTEVQLPTGFTFHSPHLNGEELSLEYSNYIELLEDGDYDLAWSCPDIGRSYSLSFTLDTQPPTLALPEVIDGQAHSAVTLTDLEPGAYILLESGGEMRTIRSSLDEIREAGTYRLTVYDQAGNYTQYDFVIHVYLNISALAAIALLVLGVGALVGYSRYVKKHPRVG